MMHTVLAQEACHGLPIKVFDLNLFPRCIFVYVEFIFVTATRLHTYDSITLHFLGNSSVARLST